MMFRRTRATLATDVIPLARLPRVLAALLLVACTPKDGEYFGPLEVSGPPALRDVTFPRIYDPLPASVFPLNSNRIRWSAVDVPGAANEPITLINFSGMSARTLAGLSLPVRLGKVDGTYEADITGLPEGPNGIRIVVPDSAGNASETTINIIKDQEAPSLTASVPSGGSTTEPSATISITGQFGDANGISAATMRVLRAQPDGTCGSGGTLFDQGTGPGTVGQNTYDLRSSVNGQFNIQLLLNGALNELRPRTTRYCAEFELIDNALNKLRETKPNILREVRTLEYRWERPPELPGVISGRVTVNGTTPLSGVTVSIGQSQTTTTDANGDYRFDGVTPGQYTVSLTSGIPPGVVCLPSSRSAHVSSGQIVIVDFDCDTFDYLLTVEVAWRHVAPGVSVACAILRVTPLAPSGAPIPMPSLAGATWTTSWSGPGVVGTTQRSGTFDANNQAIDSQQINLFGTYTVNASSTASGVTKQVSGSVAVGPTQGTCPP